MKLTKSIIVLLLIVFTFWGCEKDDICEATTSTTPRLVIRFYDIEKGTVEKNVKDLKVIGKGKTDGIIFSTLTTDAKYLTSANTISIPLDTNNNVTEYSFILDFGDATLKNIDNLKFDYVRKTIFVSRACGFKTTFQLSPTTPTHTDNDVTPDGKWIKYISVEKSNLENENETHLKIFF
jgi:Family of unknown function (DUF6452)